MIFRSNGLTQYNISVLATCFGFNVLFMAHSYTRRALNDSPGHRSAIVSVWKANVEYEPTKQFRTKSGS